MPLTRCHFMILAASVASTTVLSTESRADAPVLSESDPTAQALGYKMDTTKVDKTKFPHYQAGQTCANCALSGQAGFHQRPVPDVWRQAGRGQDGDA